MVRKLGPKSNDFYCLRNWLPNENYAENVRTCPEEPVNTTSVKQLVSSSFCKDLIVSRQAAGGGSLLHRRTGGRRGRGAPPLPCSYLPGPLFRSPEGSRLSQLFQRRQQFGCIFIDAGHIVRLQTIPAEVPAENRRPIG